MWVYLNDRIVQAERARVSVFDRGFLYGDGVFETVRIHNDDVSRVPGTVNRAFCYFDSAHF